MPTYTSLRAVPTFPVSGGGFGGSVHYAYGTVSLSTALVANDVIEFCRVPKFAIPLMGYLYGDDLDTGTETLDMDLGWLGNGVDDADPDGFGNFGVISGDAVANWKPEVGIFLPFYGTLSDGPFKFGAETVIVATVNAAAATWAAGDLSAMILYGVDPTA